MKNILKILQRGYSFGDNNNRTKYKTFNRASIMIMCIWLLISLTFLAVVIAKLAFSQINFSRFYLGRQFSYYLTKAAVRQACLERNNDMTPGYDTLGELRTPRKIDFSDYKGEYFLIDERSKININTADKEILKRLFDSEFLAQNLIDYRQKEKPHHFSFLEELLEVEGIDKDLFGELKETITVYSDGYININTACPRALLALGLESEEVEEILDFRSSNIFNSRITISRVFSDLGIKYKQSNLLKPNSSNYTVKASTYMGQRLVGKFDIVIVKTGGRFLVKSWERN